MGTHINAPKKKKNKALLIIGLVILILLAGAAAGFAFLTNQGGEVLTSRLDAPLDDISEAKVDINVGDGNLIVGSLSGDGSLLFTGSLQYLETQNPPDHALEAFSGKATLNLSASGPGKSGPRLPWEACNGLTEWQVSFNPAVSYEFKAHSDGGNIALELGDLTIRGLVADTGGGNLDVSLPVPAENLSVALESGAGNVNVFVPMGAAVSLSASTGLGTVIANPPFIQTDEDTYQTPGYEEAAVKIEITAKSGAGNVTITAR